MFSFQNENSPQALISILLFTGIHILLKSELIYYIVYDMIDYNR